MVLYMEHTYYYLTTPEGREYGPYIWVEAFASNHPLPKGTWRSERHTREEVAGGWE